jgi:hypothetical protein
MQSRSNRVALIGALCCLPLVMAASHADAAPIVDQDDSLVPEMQFAPALDTAEAKPIEGPQQPQLVAIHEIAFSYNPAQGLVQRTFHMRLCIQDSKGGLGMKTASEAVTRPAAPSQNRFSHTATSDPRVDINS